VTSLLSGQPATWVLDLSRLMTVTSHDFQQCKLCCNTASYCMISSRTHCTVVSYDLPPHAHTLSLSHASVPVSHPQNP
jgi:hypothetical protein